MNYYNMIKQLFEEKQKVIALKRRIFAVVSPRGYYFGTNEPTHKWEMFKKEKRKKSKIGHGAFEYRKAGVSRTRDALIHNKFKGKRLYPRLLKALFKTYPSKLGWAPDTILSRSAQKAWKKAVGSRKKLKEAKDLIDYITSGPRVMSGASRGFRKVVRRLERIRPKGKHLAISPGEKEVRLFTKSRLLSRIIPISREREQTRYHDNVYRNKRK